MPTLQAANIFLSPEEPLERKTILYLLHHILFSAQLKSQLISTLLAVVVVGLHMVFKGPTAAESQFCVDLLYTVISKLQAVQGTMGVIKI